MVGRSKRTVKKIKPRHKPCHRATIDMVVFGHGGGASCSHCGYDLTSYLNDSSRLAQELDHGDKVIDYLKRFLNAVKKGEPFSERWPREIKNRCPKCQYILEYGEIIDMDCGGSDF